MPSELVRASDADPVPPGLTQDEMRERIRNERRVELAFEEHRFFDVRRWKIAEETENEPIMAMQITRVRATVRSLTSGGEVGGPRVRDYMRLFTDSRGQKCTWGLDREQESPHRFCDYDMVEP